MASSFKKNLLADRDAAGNGASEYWPGGRGALTAVGTFNGSSVTLEFEGPVAGVWLQVKAMDSTGVFTTVALTANGMFVFELPEGRIRAVATGGPPTDLYVTVGRVTY